MVDNTIKVNAVQPTVINSSAPKEDQIKKDNKTSFPWENKPKEKL